MRLCAARGFEREQHVDLVAAATEIHFFAHAFEQWNTTPVDKSSESTRKRANVFSGDLVASARSPSGTLKVMLADGAGHGLAAALSALSVTEPFYSMVKKGYNHARRRARGRHRITAEQTGRGDPVVDRLFKFQVAQGETSDD